MDYLECAGVRVPASWTVEQLRLALATRSIRFTNEEEIIRAFRVGLRSKNWGERSLQRDLLDKAGIPTRKPKRKYKRRKKAIEGAK